MVSKEKLNHGLFTTSSSAPIDDDPTCLRIARSSGSGASMEGNYKQTFLQHQQHKGSLMISPHLPPPVALSLRARETASMSLKHIFDQQMSNGVLSREQATEGQQMGGLQGMRIQSMPDLRKRVPELDLSFRKAQDSNFANAQTGFGSPISTPTSSNQDLVSQSPLPVNSQLIQHNHLSPAVFSARLTPSRQPTAQMTVFYSGSVNVYDDVPADKAHAIMLLAGNSWSTSFKSPAGMARPVSSGCSTEVATAKERALSPMRAAMSQQEAPPPPAKTSAHGGGIARNAQNSASAAPAILSVASPPPSPAPGSLADGATTTQAGAAARRPNAGIELPHARKASLARFLEKRKDRVQVQQPTSDQHGANGEEKGGGGDGGESAGCSGKPNHDECTTTTPPNSKKPCIRSCSTSPSRSASNTSSKDNNTGTITKVMGGGEEGAAAQKAPVNEHRFFH